MTYLTMGKIMLKKVWRSGLKNRTTIGITPILDLQKMSSTVLHRSF